LVLNRRENARQFTFFARNEIKALIFQNKHSIVCAKILSEVAGKQQQVSTWKLFHHTELQGKLNKFLVDAVLCDISITDVVLMDTIKKQCLLKFLYKFSHQYVLPFKIISNLNTQNFNVWLLDTQHK
jgi:hypothetical protein